MQIRPQHQTPRNLATSPQLPSKPQNTEESVSLRVATYNARDLVDDIDNAQYHREPKSAESMAALVNVIKSSKADIIALQEVENTTALKELLSNFPGDTYQYSLVVDGNDPSGIDVAYLSKYPIKNYESHAGDKFKVDGRNRNFSRDMMRVDFDVEGTEVTVYNTHLKAGHPKQNGSRRMGEAKQMRKILEEDGMFDGEKHFLVAGDFNARTSVKNGQQADSPVVSFLESNNTNDTSDDLVDALDLPSAKDKWTHPSDDPSWQIDYLMAPKHMVEGSSNATVITGDDAALASDHLLLFADYTIAKEA